VKLDGNMTPETLGLADSGCDSTMLPGPWAATLGIDLQNDCTSRGSNTAGGKTTNFVYAPGVDVLFWGRKLHLNAAFNPGLPIILLGREDFFSHYKVTFDQQANLFTVEPY
jgi:hypothetical protein